MRVAFARLCPLTQTEPEENAFATVEPDAGKGEAPSDLLEAEPPV
jgi:hypothetical protein